MRRKFFAGWSRKNESWVGSLQCVCVLRRRLGTYTDLGKHPVVAAATMYVPCGVYSSASSSQLYRSCCRVL